MEYLSIKLFPNRTNTDLDKIQIYLDEKKLVFEASKSAFHTVGMSLIDYFDENSQYGEHFHLEYFGDEYYTLLAPTKCSIIFACTNARN